MKLVFLENFGLGIAAKKQAAAEHVLRNHRVKYMIDSSSHVLIIDDGSVTDGLYADLVPLLADVGNSKDAIPKEQLALELSSEEFVAPCPVCGSTEEPSVDLYPGQDWPRCPSCHSC